MAPNRTTAAMVASALLIALSAMHGSTAAPSGPSIVGAWSSPFSEDGDGDGVGDFDAAAPATREESARLPAAVNLVVLPDGNVLYWSQLDGTESIEWTIGMEQPNGRSRSRVLDVSSLVAGGVLPPPPSAWSTPSPEHAVGADMVGSEQRHLPDGRVIAIGGTRWSNEEPSAPEGFGRTELHGVPDARIFDPATAMWHAAAPMHRARYYPSMVTLADGTSLVAAGAPRLVYNSAFVPGPDPASDPLPRNVDEVEIFDPETGEWELQTDPSSRAVLPPFAHLHLLPDGSVLYPGAGMMYPPGGGDADGYAWNLYRRFDPASRAWSEAGASLLGARSNAITAMLPLRPPYDRATILVAGGTIGPWPSGYVATPLAELIEWEATRPDAVDVRPTGIMSAPRWHSSAVVLPTGEVVALSGADRDEVVDPGSGIPVVHADLYDPSTGGWRRLAAATRGRTLHNTAVLLRDGSILVGGHSPAPAHYGSHADNPAPLSSNYKDPSFEVFRPPYLFRGPRPTITALSATTAVGGSTLTVSTPRAADTSLRVVLSRLGATTHGIDSDQRTVELRHDVVDGDTIRAHLPATTVVPPGHYYLFLIADNGSGPTPSVAEIVRVTD